MPGLILLNGPVQGAAALRLGGNQPGQPVDKANGIQVLQALPQARNGASIAHGDGNVVRHLPVQLLHNLQRHGLLAFRQVGVDGGIAVIPAPLVDGRLAQLKGLLIGALDRDNVGAEGHELGHLALGGTGGHKNVGLKAGRSGVARQRGSRVARGGAGDDFGSRLPCLGHGHGRGPVLQRSCGVDAVVLDPESADAQLLGQTPRLIQGRPAHPQRGVRRRLLHRQQLPVAPHGVILPGCQLFLGQDGFDVVIVIDNIQNTAAFAVGQIGHSLIGLAAFDAFAVFDVAHRDAPFQSKSNSLWAAYTARHAKRVCCKTHNMHKR